MLYPIQAMLFGVAGGRYTIYKVLPITQAEAAHDILYKGQNVGKVVPEVTP